MKSLLARRTVFDYSLRSCMFARLPPSSSDLAERKALFRHLLLQIGGANIEKLVSSSLFAKRGACFAHRSSDHQRAPTDARRDVEASARLVKMFVGSFIQSVPQPARTVCRALDRASDRFL